jgi:hypothetical protein
VGAPSAYMGVERPSPKAFSEQRAHQPTHPAMSLDRVAPTAVPLSRLRAYQRTFGGAIRAFHFRAAGCRWRVHYRHLGEGGIGFDDPAQDQRYRNLSDEEPHEFVAKLRALADGADYERIQHRLRQQRFQAGMRFATRPVVRAAMPRRRCEPRPRSRERSPRRTCRMGGASRRGPPSQSTDDDDLEPAAGGAR